MKGRIILIHPSFLVQEFLKFTLKHGTIKISNDDLNLTMLYILNFLHSLVDRTVVLARGPTRQHTTCSVHYWSSLGPLRQELLISPAQMPSHYPLDFGHAPVFPAWSIKKVPSERGTEWLALLDCVLRRHEPVPETSIEETRNFKLENDDMQKLR